MTVYIWSGKNPKGIAQKGEMEAASEDVVRSQLERRKIQVSKIKKKPKDLFENIAMFQPKIKPKDIILFSRQFS